MVSIHIQTETIRLSQLLKFANVVQDGVEAKFRIANKEVKVNGAEEIRRGRKLVNGDRVEFAGEQSDVQSFYDRAKIFAFTSSSEGFPNVVAEALASGLPVISYDCVAGPSDLITSGENGFLVGLFDKEAFRKHLDELMVDEEKRIQMSIRARESVARLSVECIASRVLESMQGRESA